MANSYLQHSLRKVSIFVYTNCGSTKGHFKRIRIDYVEFSVHNDPPRSLFTLEHVKRATIVAEIVHIARHKNRKNLFLVCHQTLFIMNVDGFAP